MDIAVAIAIEVEQRGHAGLVADQFHKPASAARNHEVDELIGLEQCGDGIAVGGAHGLHRIFGKVRRVQSGAHAFDDHARRMAAFAAAAQDHRIARLEAQGGGIRTDIRARFIDHADHADGYGNAFDGQAVGALEGGQPATHGVGQFGDLFERAGHALDPVLGQAQAVDEAFGLAALDAFYVFGVGLQQFVRPAAQRLGGFAQRGVLRIGAGR